MKRFVGVDWGSETHAACVVDETGAVLDVFEVGHDPGGIGELVRRGVGEGESSGAMACWSMPCFARAR